MSESITICFFGASTAGKSPLILRLLKDVFVCECGPTVEDSYKTSRDIDGTKWDINLFDTNEMEEYSTIRDQYIRTQDGFVVVYAITSRTSFEEASSFIDRIHTVKGRKDVPIILVGNMCDLESERQVQTEEGQALADECGASFLETSAKDDKNVEKLIEVVARITYNSNSDNNSNSNIEDDKKCVTQ